ncbi:MAG: endonuclease/exonuclease/phosphatase family protein [bacterium]|nr:endonuclease/exonuclease/phosphatase family protein [bacterium]
MELKFVTYNIHKAIGNDRKYRPERIVEILQKQDADFIALQEVDQGVPRSSNEDLAQVLAEALGMHYVLGLNVKLSRGSYGNATLSRYPIIGSRNMNITWSIKKRRGCLITHISLPKKKELVIFNIHLGLAAFERMFQIKRMLNSHSLTALKHLPQVILGDTNDHNHKLTPVMESAGFHDSVGGQAGHHTFPSFTPRSMRPLLRLDKIFYNDRLAVSEHKVIVDPETKIASDHLPLTAVLKLR